MWLQQDVTVFVRSSGNTDIRRMYRLLTILVILATINASPAPIVVFPSVGYSLSSVYHAPVVAHSPVVHHVSLTHHPVLHGFHTPYFFKK
ncbi:unnamed protein product [Arctia plantaginis]|uniref:Uncharacterized protein n=1 Tax=Arctia plantaginis TaxID=874455 RepID=A0A8S0ZWL0_ARCPL|nr:unnamed protein product [Arctia plantaginis]